MKNIIENLREYLTDEHQGQKLMDFFDELNMSDISEVWDYLEEEEQVKAFLLLSMDDKVDLLDRLSTKEQVKLIGELSEQGLKKLLDAMEPDDLVDFIQEVSPKVREKVWDTLSEEARTDTEFLIRYDDDDAAGLMTPHYTAIIQSLTVSQALGFIRRTMHKVETVYYIYVVDQLKRLIGVLSLRDLLAAEDGHFIRDIMETNTIFVREDTDQEETARVLEENDFLALPVLDSMNRLLGIVTFDDVIDVIREEQTEDIYKMGAMGGNTTSYLETSIFGLVLKRVPWLVILLIAGTITTNVLAGYEQLMYTAAFLSLFIPVITQTGGNSGTQSSTLMIRGLATEEIRFKDIGMVMLKEILVGLIIGLITGSVIVARSYFLPPGVEFYQSLAIGLSLGMVVIFSTVFGALVPMLIHRLGFDPTVAAGPLMSTVIDVCGLTIYFKTAQIILGL